MKSIKNIKGLFTLAFVSLVLLISACEKDSNEVIEASNNPQAEALTPATAPGRELVTLSGKNLGQIVSIIFEKDSVPATFNPNFNTATNLLFRVPDTASGGPQNIIFTNSLGKKFSLPFDVIALPSVSEVSNYNFKTGTTLTLTGINLEGVTKVVFTADSNVNVQIVSKSKKQLVITMPATTLGRTQLNITNGTGTSTTLQEFVSLTNNFNLFTDTYENGQGDASWGEGGTISTNEFKSGTASFGKTFGGRSFQQMGFGYPSIANDNYTFLTFYMKGGTVDLPLWIWSSSSDGTFDAYNKDDQKILVPAKVWTYFKIPVATLKLWVTSPTFSQIGWRIKGPGGDQLGAESERLYLDDVMFVK